MIFAIVLAGGSGSRMKSELPKQFMPLGGKPVAYYSLNTFFNSDKIDRVLFVTPNSYLELGEEISEKYFSSDIDVLAGGDDRNESLMNAIKFIEKNYSLDENTVVLTHDAARPFVSEKMIEDNIAAMADADACDTCISAVDTVIEAKGGFATAMPERSSMLYCQTPQTFKAKKLKELYYSLSEQQKKTLTDAGKIFFLCGQKVKIAEGSQDNIKITYPKDFDLAEAILRK